MSGSNAKGASGGDPPQPPQPPSVGRRIRFHAVQAVGVPLLAVIPILAVFGVFGTSTGWEQAQQGALTVEVTYPERFRYKTVHPLIVRVHNDGDARFSGARASIDAGYLARFSGVSFTPAPSRVTADSYVFELGDIVPGRAVVVTGRVQAEEYWGMDGRVTVAADGAADVHITLDTFVFP